MMVIRDAQMQVFRRQLEDDFHRRLRNHLRNILPPGKFTDTELDGHIRAGIEQARDCGLSRECDAAQFVEAVCLHLDGFPPGGLPKQIRPALYSHGIHPSVKIERFIDWCRKQSPAAATCQTTSTRAK
jgi:hypothetical protein